MTFKIIGSRTRSSGLFFDFVDIRLEDGQGEVHNRDVIRHPGGVGVLPLLGTDVVLVRQYRVAVDHPVLEIPAGKLDRGEDLVEAARRELGEELGMSGTLHSLGSLLVSPGYTDEIIHLYSADDIVAGDRRPDGIEEREAEIVRMSIEEALHMVDEGLIIDAKTQIALLRAERRL